MCPKSQISYFSTSACRTRKDKLVQYKKQKYEAKLERRKKANPFATNIGLKHQLANFELPDPEDPVFQNYDSELQLSEKLETVGSQSDIFQRKFEENLPRDRYIDKKMVKMSIIEKKYFPKPREPNLVTWLEKQTMKKLFKEDPVTWTYERLAECFPVTPKGAKRIVKNQTRFKPKDIGKHDELASKNWKMLSKGNLDNSEVILKHFEEIGFDVLDGKKLENYLSRAQIQEMEQSILQDYEASLQPQKPILTGEFGMMLMHHRKRAGQNLPKKATKDVQLSEREEKTVYVENLLNAEDDFKSSLGLPSPYLGKKPFTQYFILDFFKQLW